MATINISRSLVRLRLRGTFFLAAVDPGYRTAAVDGSSCSCTGENKGSLCLQLQTQEEEDQPVPTRQQGEVKKRDAFAGN